MTQEIHIDLATSEPSVRVADATQYYHQFGYVIERFGYWGGAPRKSWGVPAWEDMGLGELEGVFLTRAEAEAALTSALNILPSYGF